MRKRLQISTISIRTRLLVAYVGIILTGFAGFALFAGGQISSTAQADYEQRLKNEIRLVAQGIGPLIPDTLDAESVTSVIDQTVNDYEAQVGGDITLFLMNGAYPPRNYFHNMPEIDAAVRGETTVVKRYDESGKNNLFTAAPVIRNRNLQAVVQLRIPNENLQIVVLQRWLTLGLAGIILTSLALSAALWLSHSIIQPLYKLRESAQRLSKGDFSHRITYSGTDEVSEVALAFNEMAQEVESMMEEQRAFASNTSHELRTPLTTIRLRTEALRTDHTLDKATTQRYIEEIDNEVARLSDLVQDLTLLSRFDAGRGELGNDQIDFARLAHSLQQQLRPQTTERNIHITLQLPTQPLPVKASLNHLLVVFRNILDNAMKYTPEGSEITWTIQEAEGSVLSVIRDSGQGIASEHLPHLFERFYRADKARSRHLPGTGLGLALVKSIVDAYDGQIRIESRGIGYGTTVYVYWPLQITPTE